MSSEKIAREVAEQIIRADEWGVLQISDEIEEALQQAVAEERERCAIIGFQTAVKGGMERSVAMAPIIDKAIRKTNQEAGHDPNNDCN